MESTKSTISFRIQEVIVTIIDPLKYIRHICHKIFIWAGNQHKVKIGQAKLEIVLRKRTVWSES